jgi:AAA family ATP:ADP antiporter
MAPHSAHAPSWLDRALRLVTDVRAGEATTALLLAANVFLILSAQYLMRPVRKALILAGAGAEIESYASALLAVLLLGVVPAYGALSARLPRRRLINLVTAFFVLCLAAFFLLIRAGTDVGIPFLLWMGVFNVMMVAQFWSFANDVYTTEEGERLFPLVAFGASLGAFAGATVAGRLIARIDLGPTLLVAAVVLAVAAVFTGIVDSRERARTEHGMPLTRTTAELPAATGEFRAASGALVRPPEAEEEAPASRGAAFRLVLRSPYLLLIAGIVLLLNWVNTNGEFILSRTVETAAASQQDLAAGQFIGRFYAGFYAVVSGLSLALQLFVVSRVLKFASVRLAVLALPVISFGVYSLLALYPLLAAVRWAKTVENATDYSLNNTVRNVLFLPTTRAEKYAAKQAIDSFFKVSGDMLSAALVFVGTTWIGFGARGFASVNLALVAVWIGFAIGAGRRYQVLAAAVAKH